MSFIDEDTGWVSSTYGRIFKTTNGGATWSIQSSSTIVHGHILSMKFVDSNYGWAVGVGSSIISTTDGGWSWQKQTADINNVILRSVSFIDANIGWICGDRGVVLSTLNGGATWVRQAVGSSSTMMGLSFFDESSGWAVGRFGTILKYSNETYPPVLASSVQQSALSMTNAPNPFNPTTVINFTLAQKNIVSIKLYNLLGQEVQTIVEMQEYDAGQHKISFNGNNLASGVYLGRIFSVDGKYQAFHKMLVIK
jgi:hypothetical protein